jgi:hypothetical protein
LTACATNLGDHQPLKKKELDEKATGSASQSVRLARIAPIQRKKQSTARTEKRQTSKRPQRGVEAEAKTKAID